jgi:hypothetical protein
MDAYSFLNDHVIVNGVEISGFAEGDDVIKVTRRVDAAMDKMGADGRMAVAFSADKSGEVTLKLMQTGSGNKYLNSLINLQAGGPQTFVPIGVMWQDTYRQDRAVGAFGYLKKLPDVQRGTNVNEQEWTIVVERLDLLLGDPLFTGLATAVAEAQ